MFTSVRVESREYLIYNLNSIFHAWSYMKDKLFLHFDQIW